MFTIECNYVPSSYKLPDKISIELVSFIKVGERLVKVYASEYGLIDITGLYTSYKKNTFEKIRDFIKSVLHG